jgi:alpha-tubulin suppressor-like RCC1 family protein
MPVMGLTSGVTAVSVGVYSACAVTAAGGVVCWGDNYYGELGNNGVSPTTCSGWACSPTPVPVTGLSSGVTAVSVGSIFACALTDGGAVMCWGEGAAGDLGNGSTARSDVPVQVTGLTNGVTAISAASASVPASVCALLADGGVLCWGFNNYSATLCLGSIPCFRTPTPAADLPSGVTAVAVGLPSCAVIGDGGVECLEDSYSEFGGSLDAGPSFAPAPVAGFTSGVTAVAVGVTTACALTTAGGLECWGSNGAGQLGNIDQMVGPQAASAVPVEVTGF